MAHTGPERPEVIPMKALFALKNVLTPNKSLKSYAWYIWY
jgi:hypothetical protein